MAIINVGSRDAEKIKKSKPKQVKASSKTGKRIQTAIHRFCKVAIYRIIESVILFITISMSAIIIGSAVVPTLAYDLSTSFGLTQGTNIYVAMASWGFPMLFYVLLISLTAFCVFKKFIKWLHGKFTYLIDKSEKTEKTEVI